MSAGGGGRGRARRWAGALAAAIMPLLAMACAPADDPATGPVVVTPEVVRQASADAADAGYLEQAEAMSDGIITEGELRRSFENLRSCGMEAGLLVSESFVNPVDGLTLMYTTEAHGLDAATVTEVDSACTQRYWQPLSVYYTATHERIMDPPLREHVATCLGERGIPLDGSETAPLDFAGPDPVHADGTLNDRATAFTECVDEGIRIAYPDLPAYGIGL